MLCLLIFLLGMPICIGQGTKYVRLPSGLTFPELTNYKNARYHASQSDANGRQRVPPSSPPRLHLGNQLAEVPGSTYYASPPPEVLVSATQSRLPYEYSQKVSALDQYKQIILKKTDLEVPEGGGSLLPEEGEGTQVEVEKGEETTDESKGEKTLEEVKGEGTHEKKKSGKITTTDPKNKNKVIQDLHSHRGPITQAEKDQNFGNVLASLGGGQFYQSIFGGKGGFSPLSFFLNAGAAKGQSNPFIVPVPIVVPPPPPPPPGPKCYTNPSGFLCCNTTLEQTMEDAFNDVRAEGISLCNAQKMATAVQEAAENMFGTTFESIVAHKDFVAKVNFAGDLNCKIEIDGKFILAYATPTKESEVNIIDANSFFSGDAEELLEGNGTEAGKPTYIVYGPI